MRNDLLHVIAVVSNPIRFRSRYELFKKFEHHVCCSGAKLHVVEVAYGDRPFEVTDPDVSTHLQLRTRHEVWHKENMINLGLARLPADWKYAAWVDADITFARTDWAAETVQQLQHYDMVQMFSHAIDLGPQEEPIQQHRGFAYTYIHNGMKAPNHTNGDYYYYDVIGTQKTDWHPGYAWAARREALERLGGLIDFAALGAGDHHMAHALIGNAANSLPGGIHPNYKDAVMRWERRANQHLKTNLGFVPGTITHHFHGSKKKRFYKERWKILTDNQFDPYADLKRDIQGLYQLTDQKPRLRDEIRAYFRSRDEDGTEV